MKRVAVVALLLLMIVLAGGSMSSRASASMRAHTDDCQPTNPPDTPCDPLGWRFVKCATDPDTGEPVEIYYCLGSHETSIRKPSN